MKLIIAFRKFAMASKKYQRTFCFICGYLRRFFSGSDYISVKPRIEYNSERAWKGAVVAHSMVVTVFP